MDEASSQRAIMPESTLKEILTTDKGKDAEIISWKTDNYTKEGDNYMFVVTALEVTYAIKGKTLSTSYVVKHSPDPFNMFGGYPVAAIKKEAQFYSEFLTVLSSELLAIGEIQLRMPRCFLTCSETKNEKIVLEDLRVKDFKFPDRRRAMNVPHMTLVLKELARLNAAGILLEKKSLLEKMEDKYGFMKVDFHNFGDNAEKFNYDFWFKTMDAATKNLANVEGYDSAIKWLSENKEKGSEIVFNLYSNTKITKTFCHGGCWANNLLFRYDDEDAPIEVMLIDLQVCRKASPVTDLQYLISTCLDKETRKECLNDLLSIYYGEFVRVLEKGGVDIPFSFEELQQEFKDKLPYGLILGLFVINLTMSDSVHSADDTENVKKGDISENLRERAQEMESGSSLLKTRTMALIDSVKAEGFTFD